MFYYAQLNENIICTGISQLSGQVTNDNLVQIPDFNDDYLWRKYEDGEWSEVKYEPVSTAPIDEFQQVKNRLEATEMALLDLLLEEGV